VPPAERDIAVVVGEAISAAAVEATITKAAGPLLEGASLFDIYQGPPLASGERSLAYRLRFVAPDRTLTEEEVEAAVATIVEALTADLGARLRS